MHRELVQNFGHRTGEGGILDKHSSCCAVSIGKRALASCYLPSILGEASFGASSNVYSTPTSSAPCIS